MIGIVSINKYAKHLNYGAALHSYAFQKFLDKNGLDNLIVDYFPKFMEGYNLKYPLLCSKTLKNIVRWSYGFRSNVIKYNKFQNFFDNHCRFTPETYTPKTLNSESLIALGFDTFICESDVIWKPATTLRVDPGYFLNFKAANVARKISYAASVGLKMTERQKEIAQKWLSSFHAVSVRELDSVEFIKQLYGNTVEWVIDPTVLLNAEDYHDIIIPPKEKNYLLLYNCMLNNKEMIRIAQNTATKLGLELIEISAFPQNALSYKHKVRTDVGIEEFLGYFANASYVFCNAFHGSCFSVIFKKPFYLFQRESYDYRLRSLIDPLGIGQVYVPRDRYSEISDLPPLVLDYNEVYETLDKFRYHSGNYVLSAIAS